MNKVTLYSPGLASYNLGDKIISESAKEQLSYVLDHSFVTEIATHTPHSFYYMRPLIKSKLKFVLGSNLLKSTFFGFKRQWDITIAKSWITGPCILVGAGWWQYGNKPNIYTKLLLKSVLSKKYIHSVRDEYTKNTLNSIGFKNVVNTSCPTMWKLTKSHCAEIARVKSENVIFTLTDYNEDFALDKKLIEKLVSSYKKVYFWPQGIGDYKYISKLITDSGKVEIIPASLKAFDDILLNGNVDYIGTRLHGGIRALQFKVRTMIISIDNRAEEKNKNFNLPIVKRTEIDKLDSFIFKEFKTEINIPEDEINDWKLQFKNT